MSNNMKEKLEKTVEDVFGLFSFCSFSKKEKLMITSETLSRVLNEQGYSELSQTKMEEQFKRTLHVTIKENIKEKVDNNNFDFLDKLTSEKLITGGYVSFYQVANLVDCIKLLGLETRKKCYEHLLETSSAVQLSFLPKLDKITNDISKQELAKKFGYKALEMVTIYLNKKDINVISSEKTGLAKNSLRRIDEIDSFQRIKNDAKRFPVLTEEEFINTFNEYKNGDFNSLNKLLVSNLKLVLSVVPNFWRRGIPGDDLAMVGVFGLLKALENFDVSLGYRFSTYAIYWIKSYMSREIKRNSKIVKIPFKVFENINKMKYHSINYNIETGKNISKEELAKKMNITIEEVDDLIGFAVEESSLNEIVESDDESILTVEDTIADSSIPFEEEVIDDVYYSEVRTILENSSLTDKEKSIIKFRFGIGVKKVLTLEELATMFNVKHQRIKQIEDEALVKLTYDKGIIALADTRDNKEEALKNLRAIQQRDRDYKDKRNKRNMEAIKRKIIAKY